MGKIFLRFWKFSVIFFIEYIVNPFCLELFSFFNAQDSHIGSFDAVGEFLHIPFTGLELFDKSSLVFFHFYFIFKF
jgi:hypothetical protein